MSRPFPNSFDEPTQNPQSAATNISYRADVNRQKTKKWTQAPAANYDGDDYGSDDDYGPEPPPLPKPTGLRQQGQAVPTPSKVDSPTVDNSKKYGDLPPLPGASSSRGRVNSFDADDEKRDFSNSTMRQPSPAASTGPPTRFSQITGVPTVRHTSGPPVLSISTQQPRQVSPAGLRKASVVSPISGSPHPDILKSGRVPTGDFVSPASDTRTPSSTVDYQARRDFSPSAVPHPLSTRASPAPQSATDSPGSRFPPRKSSVGQQAGPNLADITQKPTEDAASKPWASGRSASPARSPGTPIDKALPIIRPVDIYRRAEEEKQRERERQSMDSGRPSMDSIVGVKASERSNSPAKPLVQEKSSSDSLGSKGRTSLDGEEASDSGRRLRPMLDTVRERKSEYGYEGDNGSGPGSHTKPETSNNPQESASDGYQLEVTRPRRSSTSPKLPDLTRMSGFGIDMFSTTKSEDIGTPVTKITESTPTTSTSLDVSTNRSDDPTLRNQPSLGFRTAVNQAFETALPVTPASRSGSGVRRTDSESTGTTGISPIMSRVPSTAHPETRNQVTPSIPESIVEPNSPEVSGKPSHKDAYPDTVHQQEAANLKLEHPHDLSAHGPGNRPMHAPDLAASNPITSGLNARSSAPSPEASSHPDANDPLQPPRPFAEREQSFRPNLPGGWTSYATTDINETPTQSAEDRTQTPPTTNVHSAQHLPIEADYNSTPTTTTHPLSPSAAILSAPLPSVAPDSLKNDVPSQQRTPSFGKRKLVAGNADLPTPDLSMAPSGNLYSTNTLDPRLMPKLEQAPPETQLRPDVVHRPSSDDSTMAPPPPPKDTPRLDSTDNGTGYFSKPTASLQQGVAEANNNLGSSQRPTVLPTSSTDTNLYHETNDRLQKEIVQSLSPRPSDLTPQDASRLSTLTVDSATGGQARESTYLPTEYGDYWADTAETTEAVPEITPTQKDVKSQSGTPISNVGRAGEPTDPVVLPLSTLRSEPTGLETPRPQLQNRFSWEGGPESEVVNANPSVTSPTYAHDISNNPPQAPSQQQQEPSARTGSPSTVVATSTAPQVPGDAATPLPPANSQPNQSSATEHHGGRDVAILTGAAALGGTAAAIVAHESQAASGRRLSLAEEKDPQVSSYPISPTPPDHEHPANSQQPYFSTTSDLRSHPPAPSTVSPLQSPTIAHASPVTSTAKILSFGEIAAIKTTQERIHQFNETRHNFANMDSGLDEWISKLKNQYPEHASATGSWSGSGSNVLPVGSARSRVGPPPLQQPYYQQYLNASSPTTPPTPTSRPAGLGSNPMTGSQQGPSPGGSKLTGQQVQAKGKELLHSAGIFGGKAGKAGKGLFAKSKNKLRGAGGGDKTPPTDQPSQSSSQEILSSQPTQSNQSSPAPKTKSDRRSSWGLPLGLTRSSGRPDVSNRNSRESTPTGTPQRTRAPTMTSDIAPPTPPQHSSVSLTGAPHSMSGALPASHSPLQQHPPGPVTIRQVQQQNIEPESSKDRESLSVPAPIGKTQPTWDSFNATPIAEEEGFQYDNRNKQNKIPAVTANQHISLPAPTAMNTRSDRSNSEDAQFYDANEDPADITNDWVLVAPETAKDADASHGVIAEPKIGPKPAHEVQPKVEPKDTPIAQGSIIGSRTAPPAEQNVEAKDEPESEPEPPPVISILDRPRGSFEYTSPPLSAKSVNGPASSSLGRGAPPTDQPLPAQPIQNPYQYPPAAAQYQQFPTSQQPSYRASLPLAPTNQSFSEPVKADSERPTSSFLPPIRRTSTFGLGFGSRQSKTRFPIEDDDDDDIQKHRAQQPTPTNTGSGGAILGAAVVGAAGPAAYASHDDKSNRSQTGSGINPQGNPYQPPPPGPPQSSSYQQVPPSTQSAPSAAAFVPKSLSDQRQRTVVQQQIPTQSVNASRPADVLQRPEFKESQVEWRPNRPKGTPPAQVPSSYYKETDMPPPARTNSWEPQRQRPYSGSSQSFSQRPDGQGQGRPFEQPPSAAQKYPALFKSGSEQQGPEKSKDPSDLPAHYYQAPIPREAAFLPRQQTNEYQLPGVGPPIDEPRPTGSNRNSGFFKEIGGKISRASSRSRANSVSRDGGASVSRPSESRGDEYAESSIASEDAQERSKRRMSFFSSLNRASTVGLGAPQSRESIIAHNPGSRTDLLASGGPSPVSQHDRKRSFFGGISSTEPKPPQNKLLRASTGLPAQELGKKKRFSGLSGLFNKQNPSKETPQTQPQATRELLYSERQPIDSPQFGPRQQMQLPPNGQAQIAYNPPLGPPPGRAQTDYSPPPGPPPNHLKSQANSTPPPASLLNQARAPANFLPPVGQRAPENYTSSPGFSSNETRTPTSATAPQTKAAENYNSPTGGSPNQARGPSASFIPPVGQRAPENYNPPVGGSPNHARGPSASFIPPVGQRAPENYNPPVGGSPNQSRASAGFTSPVGQRAPENYAPPTGPPPNQARSSTGFTSPVGQRAPENYAPPTGPSPNQARSSAGFTSSVGQRAPEKSTPPGSLPDQTRAASTSFTPPVGQRAPENYTPPPGSLPGQPRTPGSFTSSTGQMRALENHNSPVGASPSQSRTPSSSFTPPVGQRAPEKYAPPTGPPLNQARAASASFTPPVGQRAPGKYTPPPGSLPNQGRASSSLTPPAGQMRASGGRTSPLGHQPPQVRAQTTYNSPAAPFLNKARASTNVTPPPGPPGTLNPGQTQAASQSRSVLSKLTTSKGSPKAPRQESKPRKSSTSGLLGGLIGRRSHQDDRSSEDSRSQGSQPKSKGHQLPPAQSYTDIQEAQPQGSPSQARGPSFQSPSTQGPERGRRSSREPQYDNVPIPGGYALVHGQGAMTVATEYDPRGLRNMQQPDPRYAQQQPMRNFSGNPPSGANFPPPQQSQPQGYANRQEYGPSYAQQHQLQPVQTVRQISHPDSRLSAQNSVADQRSAGRRLSREDMLARSPPKSPEGQQRPYQLTLPGDGDGEEDDLRPAPVDKDIPNFPSPPNNQILNPRLLTKQLDPVQRLQQPTLRHPESPAGYPLPEDSVYSPINESARNLPPPPPPKWPGGREPQHQAHERNSSLTQSLSTVDIDLDRSNTRRTAVSAISGLSAPHSPHKDTSQGRLNVPNARDQDPDSRSGGNISSPSPTPPSPLPGTPERAVSPEQAETPEPTKMTVLDVKKKGGEDLYDASPRLPKPASPGSGPGGEGSSSNGNAVVARGDSLARGKENQKLSLDPKRGQVATFPDDKIVAEGPENVIHELEDSTTAMSATSYPGQEWNPYGSGAWEDD